MLLNLKRINRLKNFNNYNYFDENFFMYLENDDLCKRIIENNEDIYVVPTSKIKHLGGKGVDIKYKNEIEYLRNWHWIWSKFYFNKKHFGYSIAFIKGFPKFLSSLIKCFFYFLIKDKTKKKIYKIELWVFIMLQEIKNLGIDQILIFSDRENQLNFLLYNLF